MEPLVLAIEGASWLAAARAEWDALVELCDCDPLFNGWAWRATWWARFGSLLEGSLSVLTLREGGRLVAALPVYMRKVRLFGVLPVSRLELVGGCLQSAGRSEFSEYLDACVARGYEQRAADVIIPALLALPWDELHLQNVPETGWIERHVVPALAARGMYLLELGAMRTWHVDVANGFAPWARGLDANIRRRAIAHRARLDAPAVRKIPATELGEFFALLNGFHRQRWGKAIYSDARIRFHQELLALLGPRANQATVLMHAGQPLSALYDVRVGDTVYSIQSGFGDGVKRTVSIGYLHLAYGVEAAAAEGAKAVDLLGGGGKHRDYKKDLGQPGALIVSRSAIRAPLLRAAVRAQEAVRRLRASALKAAEDPAPGTGSDERH